jgi:hypothetical protein
MPKRKKVGDVASNVGDVATEAGNLAEEARSLLTRLIDESQLREAVAKLIADSQAVAEDLPAKGRQAKKQATQEAAKQLKLAKKQATREAAKQLKLARKQAAKQQEKLARKGAGLAAEGKTLAKQKKPGLKGKLGLGLVAAIGALTVSEKLRSKVLDLLFGAEEEFQYTPPEPPAEETPGAPLSAV